MKLPLRCLDEIASSECRGGGRFFDQSLSRWLSRPVGLFPETLLEQCVRALPEDFLEDPGGRWAHDLSYGEALAVSGPYADYRRCLEVTGQPLGSIPTPASLEAIRTFTDVGDGELLFFYGLCRGENLEETQKVCKRLIKGYAVSYLKRTADWDVLCESWCQAFIEPNPNACENAVESFGDSLYKNRDSLVILCREFTGLERAVCGDVPSERQPPCGRRAQLIDAVRTGDTEICSAEMRWQCEAVLGGREYCDRRFSNLLAVTLCKAREGG